jgi:hypothetical protein
MAGSRCYNSLSDDGLRRDHAHHDVGPEVHTMPLFRVLLVAFLLGSATASAIDPSEIERGKTLVYIPSLIGKVLEFYQQKQPLGDHFAPIEVPAGKAAVYLYREKRIAASAILIPVSIDGVPITQLQSGGFAVALVEPGEHVLAFPERVIPPGDLAFPGPAARARTIGDKILSVQVEAGVDVYLEARTKVGMNDCAIDFDRRAPAVAASRIAKTRRSPMPAPDRPLPATSPEN